MSSSPPNPPLPSTLAPPRPTADTAEAATLAQSVSALPVGSMTIPGYEVLQELGRGGMGVVYKARQVKADRLVALKMILAGEHASDADQRRFQIEAEAVARLRHPNIVQVYEVGEHEGRPFFSFEFCAGGSLEEKLSGTPLPPDDAAEMVQTLARAMQAAHQERVIHRDLKPANVLLASGGCEPPGRSEPGRLHAPLAEFTPKITDFGLARKLDEVGQTQSGAVMGTPSYMAPEQASGKTKEIGPAADVYALGAILYECLTGRPPFRAATTLDTILQVLEQDPVPVRLLNPLVERDLETICLHCLEKDPRRRYVSAEALAADLDRFLRREAISIRSVNVLDRLARTLERSNLGVEFHHWGTVVLLWAAIVLVSHVILFVWINPWPAGHSYSPLAYVVQFLLMALAYWRFRPRRDRPVSASEQRLWAVWLGYLLGCTLLLVHGFLMPGFRDGVLRWGTYPSAALLTGLAFFVLGSSHWGWFYAFGLAFFAVSMVMPLRLEWSPLEFGLLWSAALLIVGLQLRRLGRAPEQKLPKGEPPG